MRRLATLATALIVSAAGITSAFADTVTIRYSNWLPPNFFLWDNALKPWIDEVEKVTEGRVKVDVLPKVVGTAASQFDVVSDGLADMAFITAPYTPGRFPLMNFGELPLLSSDEIAIAPAIDKIYREHLEKFGEFDGIKVLSIFTISPSQIFTKTRPVKSLDDLKGLKLRSPTSGTQAFLDLVGGVSISKPSTEAFEMLATGVIDGQITQANTVTGFGAKDLTQYAFLLPGGVSNAINLVGINPEKWAEISPADQDAIMAISAGDLALRVGTAYAAAEDAAMEELQASGYEVIEADPELVAKLRETTQPIVDKWIATAKENGLENPQAILDEYRAAYSAGQ